MSERNGFSLSEFVVNALEEALRKEQAGTDRPWMKHFGKLAYLHTETARINRIIEREFGRIDQADW